jgi:DnaJ-class molecular chaperone
MQFGNLYDRLGVDTRASNERIHEAYQEVMKSLEPEPHFRDKIEDLRSRLDKVKKKVTEAYDILTDPVQRGAYDRSIDGPSPEATLAPEASSEEQATMEKTIAESSQI